jgi:hypothetical protein
MTAVRVAVALVLVAAGLVVFYGLVLDRSGQNIAFTVAGLAVLGLTSAFVAAWFFVSSLAQARLGRAARAISGSVAGGLFAIAAAMSLAAASVFAILTRVG